MLVSGCIPRRTTRCEYRMKPETHDKAHQNYDYHSRLYRFQVAPNRPEERYGLVSFPGEWHYSED